MIGIITCTTECNLRCKYCFEENDLKCSVIMPVDKINKQFQDSLPLLKKFGKQLVEYNSARKLKTEFTFHGGEPMLINPRHIDELCEYYCTLGDVDFNIQTNGTLISDDYISLFKKFGFRVGISIDGDKATHDENRVNYYGKGTHDIVLKNLLKLKKAGIVVGAMATITSSVSENAKEFYDFYCKNNIDIGFNACYNSPNVINSGKKLDIKQYSAFLKELFDIWINDNDSKIMIKPFGRIIRNMVRPCSSMQVCQFIEDCRDTNICITTNGKVYQCLHYCNLPNGEIGNINVETIEEIMKRHLSTPKRWDELKNSDCKDCDIYDYCYGGCPYWRDASELTGLSGDFNCASQKVIVHHIYNVLKSKKQ